MSLNVIEIEGATGDSRATGALIEMMKIHIFTTNPVLDTGEVIRNSIGGYPILNENQDWFECGICGARQIVFLQFDIAEEFNLPFASGSHLSVFMCPHHNDAPISYFGSRTLPNDYWKNGEFYRLILNPPNIKERLLDLEPHLLYQSLNFEEVEESISAEDFEVENYEIGSSGLKVGGVPFWIQEPEVYNCFCGAQMKFVCQIPEDFGFDKSPEAESHPDSFSADSYYLFLGNEVYIFACADQCNPLAVIAVAQN